MEKQKKTVSVKTWIVIALFALAAILSAIFMGRVAINYNLADYLGEDTETKIALNIIEDEFGMTGNIQVMAKNVTADTAKEIRDAIETVPNVINVNFDEYDETYYKENNALFIVILDGDDYSENAKQAAVDIKILLSAYDGMEYGGTVIEKQALQDAITSEMVYILAISLCLVVAILLITSESWMEPFLLLAASGVAILINRGTNFFFGEISYITNSIAAILQLALSMDYSIVLLHAYRNKKQEVSDNGAAMKQAILSVLKPISASALTTIAGLLALLFMSFRIGFDIGIVLMKGIVISAVTSVTLLPALVLLCDRLMRRTKKHAFAPKGRLFCRIAGKAGHVIVPIALVLVILGGCLQSGNRYLFTDTKSGNPEISNVFGNNNSVVVVYRNSDNNYANEKSLADALYAYRTADGKVVLSNYTAYTNTVRELYDTEKAVQKLNISEKDAGMLFTMYNLYRAPAGVTLTFADFVDFANDLIDTDEDAQDFVDDDTRKTLQTLKVISEAMDTPLSAEELYEVLTTGVMEGTDIRLFPIRQLYGMYFYHEVTEKRVDFQTMLDFMIASSSNEDVKDMYDSTTLLQLRFLSLGIGQFNTKMETPMDKETFGGWLYQNYSIQLTEEELTRLYAGYFVMTGEPVSETIPLLPLLKFMVAAGQITDREAVTTIAGYDSLYRNIHASYTYEEFLPALSGIATALAGQAPTITVTDASIQQLYILYFYEQGTMPDGRMTGKTFAEYALAADGSNTVVHEQLTDENRNKLHDMLTVHRYHADTSAMTYQEAYIRLTALQEEILSDMATSALEEDKISGVYIKYACHDSAGLTAPMMAYELLDFVSDHMDTNTLLIRKMSDDNRKKVSDAKEDIQTANDLFLSDTYSRMLLSVNLPNESEDTTEFVKYLSAEAKNIFGPDAYITGEIVSTYDLQKSFDHDNLFITVFTLISIFVIVMLIFRSLSLPIILVAVIQGAIFIAMSTQLTGSGIFFMSYIVSTCILMGATIDYGILMSSNYVAYRSRYGKHQSLDLSVNAAMPTVFTSGLILIVCGFVIHFISSQNSISTVGLLLGIGTLCSVVMITVVLPSVLYLCDSFILSLSVHKRRRGKETYVRASQTLASAPTEKDDR